MCGQKMCRGCLVPYRKDDDLKIQDYLDRLEGSNSLEEYYEGGQELALRLTWNKHIPMNLLEYLIYSDKTQLYEPVDRNFNQKHPEFEYEADPEARNYK